MSTRRYAIAALAAIVLGVLPVGWFAEPAGAGSSLDWSHQFNFRWPGSSPTIADVDGDGQRDIVVGGHDGWLRVFRADGSYVPGWPQPVIVKGSTPTAVDTTATVADLDGDGRNEVIVGAGSGWVENQHGGLVVFNRDGSVRWRFVPADKFTAWGMGPDPDGYTEGVKSTVAVGDVDGDGYNDVVFGAWDHKIRALDRHGRLLPGFPVEHEDTITSSPALYDVDGDGRMEIFIGGDSMAGGAEDWNGGVLRALDWYGGRVYEQWKAREGDIFLSSPAIGDVDGDGRMELVIGSGTFYNNEASKQVYAYNLEDGSRVGGWPRKTGAHVTSSPALADLDGDGRLDVTIASKDGRLYAWRGDGSTIWAVDPAKGSGKTAGQMSSSPVVADVDGDGRLEVVVVGASGAFVVDGRSGAHEQFLGYQWGGLNSVAVGNFGARGWKMIATGYLSDPHRGRIAAYGIPAPKGGTPWPEYRKNQHHTGAYPGSDSADWASGGIRFVNREGAIYALGDAAYSGGANVFPHPGIVEAIPDPNGDGYGLMGSNGSIYAFGSFRFYGAATNIYTVGEFVAGWAHPSGEGYYLMTDRGAIYTYGKVPFYGAATNIYTVGKFVDGWMHPSGKGYYLMTDRGAIYTFGTVPFYGAATDINTVGAFKVGLMDPGGRGYHLLTDRGAVYTFGYVPFHGAATDQTSAPIVDGFMHPDGKGYWLADRDGRLYKFGGVTNFGSIDMYHPGEVVAVF